jgi:hypothetical protein
MEKAISGFQKPFINGKTIFHVPKNGYGVVGNLLFSDPFAL